MEELAGEFEVKVKISKERRNEKEDEDGREGETFLDCEESKKGYVTGGTVTVTAKGSDERGESVFRGEEQSRASSATKSGKEEEK